MNDYCARTPRPLIAIDAGAAGDGTLYKCRMFLRCANWEWSIMAPLRGVAFGPHSCPPSLWDFADDRGPPTACPQHKMSNADPSLDRRTVPLPGSIPKVERSGPRRSIAHP